MQSAVEAERGVYAVGEEVVVHLAGVEVFDAGDGASIPQAVLPVWTIGEISGVFGEEGREQYAVFFIWRAALRACLVGANAIEGTA